MPRVAVPENLTSTGRASPLTSARPSVTVRVLLPPVSSTLPAGTPSTTPVGSSSRIATVAALSGADAIV